MEMGRPHIQLYILPVWSCDSTDSMCEVIQMYCLYFQLYCYCTLLYWMMLQYPSQFFFFFQTGRVYPCACSNTFLINDHINKREWTYIFGAVSMLTIFTPSFKNYRIWSFFGLIMITYTAWYMTIASIIYGQVKPFKL